MKALRFFQEFTLVAVVAVNLLPRVSAAAHLHYNLRYLLLASLLSLIASPLSRHKRTSLTSLTIFTTFTTLASTSPISDPLVTALQLFTALHWASYLFAYHRIPTTSMNNWRAPSQPCAKRYSIPYNPALHPRLVG